MMKRIITILLIACLSISIIGCGKEKDNKKKQDDKVEQQDNSVDEKEQQDKSQEDESLAKELLEDVNPKNFKMQEVGILLTYPKLWHENFDDMMGCVDGGFQLKTKSGYSLEVYKSVLWNYFTNQNSYHLANLFVVTKDEWNKMIENNNSIKDFLTEENRLLFEQEPTITTHEENGYMYIIITPDKSKIAEKTDEDKQYKNMLVTSEELLKSIEFIEVVTQEERDKRVNESFTVVPQFKAKDTNGNDIDNSIFEGKKLTMINIWATTCGACVDEMPELQELYKDMKEKDINVIGIVTDGSEELELTKTIIEKTGVEYTNIVPDDSLNEYLKKLTATPTTIFVNEKGEKVGDIQIGIPGENAKEAYEEEIIKRLK
ncbi:TlpA disulfide reductase family protein [Vallitalea guaymasensis]|uniref:TlpA disulfide reductase family protein n=1 Tax=Vallitalea guaymasensis TaxID=1185412 RepID=UPI0023523CD2|nr:TlpA disulfide reductase family protein [Vallitalea guaymasensis]